MKFSSAENTFVVLFIYIHESKCHKCDSLRKGTEEKGQNTFFCIQNITRKLKVTNTLEESQSYRAQEIEVNGNMSKSHNPEKNFKEGKAYKLKINKHRNQSGHDIKQCSHSILIEY